MGRVDDRKDIPDHNRITLLESDMDIVYTALTAQGHETRAEITALRDEQKKGLDSLRTVLIGLLSATAAAAILMAINLVVQGQ